MKSRIKWSMFLDLILAVWIGTTMLLPHQQGQYPLLPWLLGADFLSVVCLLWDAAVLFRMLKMPQMRAAVLMQKRRLSDYCVIVSFLIYQVISVVNELMVGDVAGAVWNAVAAAIFIWLLWRDGHDMKERAKQLIGDKSQQLLDAVKIADPVPKGVGV